MRAQQSSAQPYPVGLGYRREMHDWEFAAWPHQFFEVVPENWLRRDRTRLHALAQQRPVHFHGVSLNLGGDGEISPAFLAELRSVLAEFPNAHYSDHLAASGDAHQLYDLFPIPFTREFVGYVADRVKRVQDGLGHRMAVENASYYTNIGTMPEPDFLMAVAEAADCQILLDINNIEVNWKNHGLVDLPDYLAKIDPARVSYLHLAGHEWDERFDLHIDTHGALYTPRSLAFAQQFAAQHGKGILLEWDNTLPEADALMACVQTLAGSATP